MDTDSDRPQIRISGGSGYGYSGWTEGEIIRHPNRERRGRKDEPEWLTVLSASRRYVREDGLSIGVGDDRGYIYSATCRPATAEEIAPLLSAEQAATAQVDTTRKLTALHVGIMTHGEIADPAAGQLTPEGSTIPLGAGQDIYGGGRWFVLGPDWIWAVANNGMDGDDWSLNNVRTGGAGAIGRCVRTTSELVGQIRRLTMQANQ